MKRILLLKTKKNENDEKFNEMLNLYGKEDEVEIIFNFFQDIKIVIDIDTVNKVEILVNGEDIRNFDLIYFKSWLKKAWLAPALAKYLDNAHKKYIDSSIKDLLIGGKLIQTMIIALGGLPVPRTIYLSPDLLSSSYFELKNLLGEEFVAKEVKGSKGDNNFLITSEEEYKSKVVDNVSMRFIFQQFIPNDFDFRFLTLGNSVRTAEKRIRVSHKYLNNASRGGKEEFFDPNEEPELAHLASRVSKLFGREINGVDIIVSKVTKKPYILEVNPSPGFTYEYDAPEVKALYQYLKSLI